MSHGQTQNQVPTTFIGIAYYSTGDCNYQSVIVLSKSPSFDTVELLGTVIESVNGWVEHWWESGKTPAVFEPYLILEGIMPITKVNRSAKELAQFISNLRWNVSGARSHTCGGLKRRFPDHYVQQAFIKLNGDGIIRMPGRFDILSDFDIYTMHGLIQLNQMRESKPDLLHLISLEDILEGKR